MKVTTQWDESFIPPKQQLAIVLEGPSDIDAMLAFLARQQFFGLSTGGMMQQSVQQFARHLKAELETERAMMSDLVKRHTPPR